MIPLVLALTANAAGAIPRTPALERLDQLSGCWNVPGKVRGTDATSVARGSWHLGGRYFMLQVKSTNSKNPYEAALVYGAGDKPDQIHAFWMDTFGGAYSVAGSGEVSDNGFTVVYAYPDSTYTNRFVRNGRNWRWTIMEKDGRGELLFAEYQLTPTTCRNKRFGF